MTYDIAPELNAPIQQEWGCCTNTLEWHVTANVCPSQLWHAGIDLGWESNPDAHQFATRKGTVRYNAGFPWNPNGAGPCGVGVEESDTGNLIMYFHLASNVVKVGQVVQPGDLIGTTGSLGAARGNHAHIEIREAGHWQAGANNYNLDPRPYLTNLTPVPAPQPQEDDDVKPILAQRDDTATDPHGAGAVYLVVDWPAGPKHHIHSEADLKPYLAECGPVQKKSGYILDRMADGYEIAAGTYPVET